MLPVQTKLLICMLFTVHNIVAQQLCGLFLCLKSFEILMQFMKEPYVATMKNTYCYEITKTIPPKFSQFRTKHMFV